MLRICVLVLIGVCVWTALFPSKDSREHPTAFLERSEMGQMVLSEARAAISSADALVQSTESGTR